LGVVSGAVAARAMSGWSHVINEAAELAASKPSF